MASNRLVRRPVGARHGAALLALLVLAAAAASLPFGSSGSAAVAPGIRVSGNRLVGSGGGPAIRLLGVDRSGAEYMCTNSADPTVFDGPTNAASIAAIRSWHTDAVRVPLNEDCWLGIGGAAPRLSGTAYRRAVRRYVSALGSAGLYVVLDLHWAAPGTILATEQWPMADADHAPAFWRSVAATFAGDRGVVFDLFNEPFITSWTCWRDGCATTFTDSAGAHVSDRTAGMQQHLAALAR